MGLAWLTFNLCTFGAISRNLLKVDFQSVHFLGWCAGSNGGGGGRKLAWVLLAADGWETRHGTAGAPMVSTKVMILDLYCTHTHTSEQASVKPICFLSHVN